MHIVVLIAAAVIVFMIMIIAERPWQFLTSFALLILLSTWILLAGSSPATVAKTSIIYIQNILVEEESIRVIAYKDKNDTVHVIPVSSVFREPPPLKSRVKITEKNPWRFGVYFPDPETNCLRFDIVD